MFNLKKIPFELKGSLILFCEKVRLDKIKTEILSRQLAELLPMDENFLLLFRYKNPLDSSVEFMKVCQSAGL